MKYLFLSNSIGGLKSFRTEIIEKILSNGDEVHICSPIEVENYGEVFINKGCKIYPIALSRHGQNPIKELFIIVKLYQLIRTIHPDIVLSYTIKPNIYGSIVCRLCKIPIIASVTGLGRLMESKGFGFKINKILLKFGMTFADHVFFQNQESMEFFRRNKIVLKSQSLIAGSGVNLNKFKFSDYPDSKKGIHYLYTGRILKEKGVGLFLDAAIIIKKEYPNSYFHIVGIKDDLEISQKVEEFHKKGIVEYHGPQNDVRPFILASHCQIHPTYYAEGMSNVLLESAAMGRPAITTDNSGCKEIVDDGYTGFIIPQNDLKSLINAIRKFSLLSDEQRMQLGKRAHEKVVKYFNRDKVVEEYLNRAQILIREKSMINRKLTD